MNDTLFSVADQIVLVSGGSRGIGKAMAAAFAQRGAKVTITGRDETTLTQAAEEIGATAMVTDCHTPAERGKAQGMNDFFVFAATAAVSFLAGSILHSSGWQAVNWMIFPALALILVPLLWQAARKPALPAPV